MKYISNTRNIFSLHSSSGVNPSWLDWPASFHTQTIMSHNENKVNKMCVFEYCQTQQFTQTLSCYIFIGSPMSQQLTSFYHLSLTTCHLDNWKYFVNFYWCVFWGGGNHYWIMWFRNLVLLKLMRVVLRPSSVVHMLVEFFNRWRHVFFCRQCHLPR